MQKKIVFILLLAFLCTTIYAQNNTINQIIDEIVLVLEDIGFTDYTLNSEEKYITANSDTEFASKGAIIGLDNIISQCSQTNSKKWYLIIKNHFMQIKKIQKEEIEFSSILENYESAKSILFMRLYPLDYLKYLDSAVYKKNNLGFFEVAVINYPSTVRVLDMNYLEKWNITPDEVMEQALKNTLNNNKEEFGEYEFVNNANIFLMSSSTNLFMTTNFLNLSKIKIPIGKYGTFVSLPNRINIPAFKLDDKSTINYFTIEFMKLTLYMYNQGPGSISSNFFWYDGQDVYLVTNDVKTGKIILPEKLVKMMQ